MTLATNLMMQYWQQQNQLPPGYRRVEYLESTGEQWIDTGVVITDDLQAWTDVQFTDTSTLNQINGGFYAASSKVYRADLAGIASNGHFWLGCSTASLGATLPTPDLQRHLFYINTHTGEWSFDGLHGVLSQVVFPATTVRLYLFNRNDQTQPPGYGCKQKLYSNKISLSNGIYLRSFVPCVRISDNKPGMYDLCDSICPLTSSPFYVNSGTAADFTWGELQ